MTSIVVWDSSEGRHMQFTGVQGNPRDLRGLVTQVTLRALKVNEIPAACLAFRNSRWVASVTREVIVCIHRCEESLFVCKDVFNAQR